MEIILMIPNKTAAYGKNSSIQNEDFSKVKREEFNLKEILIEILKKRGGKACYSEIYNDCDIITKNKISHATIRSKIESYSSDSKKWNKKEDLFYSCYGKGKGWWGLRNL